MRLKQSERNIFLILTIMIGICSEIAFTFYFVRYYYHPDILYLFKAGIFHLSASFVIFMIPHFYPQGFDQSISIHYRVHLSGYLTLFFPLIGLFGSGLSLIFAKKILKTKGLADEISNLLMLKEKTHIYQIQDSDEMLKKELKIQPLQDILSGDNIDMKRGAVKYLEKVGSPEAVRLLKKCLTSNDLELRFYTHSSLVKLDKNYTDQIKLITDKIKETGEEPDLIRQLASVYIRYANSEILEDSTRRYYLNLAHDIYESLLVKNSENVEILYIVGKHYIFEKKYQKAEEIFYKAMSIEPENALPILNLMQIYYEKRDLTSLSRIAQKIKQMKQVNTDHVDQKILLHFWGEG